MTGDAEIMTIKELREVAQQVAKVKASPVTTKVPKKPTTPGAIFQRHVAGVCVPSLAGLQV